MTQYVAVKFNELHLRTYTYSNDGQPVIAGDTVEVPTQRGNKNVVVHSVSDAEPKFACKAIIGKVEIEERSAI